MFSEEQKRGIIERQTSNTKVIAFELAVLALPLDPKTYLPMDQYERRVTQLMLQAERIGEWLGGTNQS